MSDNYPDGVTESDIPGNRPRDIAWDKAVEQLTQEWAEHCADHEPECDCTLVQRNGGNGDGEFVLCMKLITKYDPEHKEIVLWGRGGCDPAACPFFEEHVEALVEELMESGR